MTTQEDLKKEWEKSKKKLIEISNETKKIVKKGEKEFIKYSRLSKLHVDATAIGLKKKHLYYLIGKEYIKSNEKKRQSKELKKLLDEFNKITKEQEELKNKIKKSEK